MYKDFDWKLFWLLIVIFIPFIVISIFLLPGDYKALSFVLVIVFWITYYVIVSKKKKARLK